MAKCLSEQIDLAIAKGEALTGRVSQAKTVTYDAARGQIDVQLTNGCLFSLPPSIIEGLSGQSAQDIADVAITGTGFGLCWERLDIDLSLPDLMAGLFGTRVWMDSQRAAVAGAARSVAKSAAARRNGAKGGRPRKA